MASDDEVVIKVSADLAAAMNHLDGLNDKFQSLIDGLKALRDHAAATGESTEVLDKALAQFGVTISETLATANQNIVGAATALTGAAIETLGTVEATKIAAEVMGTTVEGVKDIYVAFGASAQDGLGAADAAMTGTKDAAAGLSEELGGNLAPAADTTNASVTPLMETLQSDQPMLPGLDELQPKMEAHVDTTKEASEVQLSFAENLDKGTEVTWKLAEAVTNLTQQREADRASFASFSDEQKQKTAELTQTLLAQGVAYKDIAASAGLSVEALKMLNEEQAALKAKIEEAAQAAKPFWEKWTEDIKASEVATVTFGVIVADAFKKIGEEIVNVIKAFPDFIQSMADAGDEAKTMAARLGTTVRAIKEMEYIGKQAGVSTETMARAMQGLSVSLTDASNKSTKAIRALGLSISELKQMSDADALRTIVDRIKALPPEIDKGAKMMEVFGSKARLMTQLVSEDIGQLQQDFKDLGGLENQEALAELGDTFNDLNTNIQVAGDSFKRTVAVMFLPAINDVLKQVPELGGAVITAGDALMGFGESFLPILTNIALLKGAGFLTWIKTTSAAIPGLTFVTNMLSISIRGLVTALGPLALAAAAAFAIWETWQAANAESGWIREMSDHFEYAALRLMGFSDAEAEAAIQADHLRQKTKELREEQEALARAQARVFTEVEIGVLDALGEEIRRLDAEYDKFLKGGNVEKVRAALKQGMLKTEDIATMANTTEEVVKRFQKAMDDMEKAAGKTPLGKFKADMAGLREEMRLANESGASAKMMLEQFGEQAQKARTQALLLPGGLREITQEMLALADAADLKALNEMMEDFHKITLKVAFAWQRDMRAAAQAWADFTGKQLTAAIVNISTIEQQLLLNQKVGLDKRIEMLEQAEAKEVAIVMSRLGVSVEIQTRELNAVRAKYDDLRAMERQYTGDIARDQEARGQKTLKELKHIAAAERAHYNNMLAAWKSGQADFTEVQLKEQERRADATDREAGHFVKTWKGAFKGVIEGVSQIGHSFARIADVAGKVNLAKAFDFSSSMADGIKGLIQAEGVVGKITAAVQLATTAVLGLWDAFTRSPGEDVVRRVGNRLGVVIGEEMGDTIAKTAKEKFKGDRFAAEVFHLADIVEAAGGVTEKNFERLLGGLRDTFVMLGKNMFTVEQAREVLDKNFGAFADHVVKSGKIASASFLEIISLNQKLGTNSKEIADFVTGQMTRLGKAFETLVSPLAKSAEPFKDLKKETEELAKLTIDHNKEIEEQRKRVGRASSDATSSVNKHADALKRETTELAKLKPGTKAYEDQKKEVDKLTASNKKHTDELKKEQAALAKLKPGSKAYIDQKKKVDALIGSQKTHIKGIEDEKKKLAELEKTGGKAYADQKKKVDELLAKQKEAAAKAMPAIERAGRLMMGSFNASIKSGMSMMGAVEELSPGLDSLLKTMEGLGIKVEDTSVSWIVAFRNKVNANKELVESTGSLNDIMLAMSNIGALDADTFKDLQDQGLESYAKLEAAGFKENERLTMMKGFLESARDAHANMGLPIDENTQRLITQAEQAGIIKEQQLDTNKIMMEGLGAIIEAVGGKLPAAWKTAQEAATGSAKTVADDIDKSINRTIEEQEKKLQQNAWDEYARDANRAALAAKKSIEKIGGELEDVDAALDGTDWNGWAREGIDAAGRVEGAVTGVAEGHSPGGIKDIPIRLAQAERAFKVWERTGVTSATQVQDAIDAMRGRDLGVAGIRTAGIPTQVASGDFVREVTRGDDGGVAGRENVNLTFNITSMDPAGVELVTERKILPAMVKILRRGRNLADMQTVLNLKG